MAKAGGKRIAHRRRRQHRVRKTVTPPATNIAVRPSQSDPSAVQSSTGSPTDLTAVDLTVGSPTIGTPALSHSLQAVDLTVGLTAGPPAVGGMAGPTLFVNPGRRRTLDSASVAQLQDRLKAHLRATGWVKQSSAAEVVRRWMQDDGQQLPDGDWLIIRQILRPAYQEVFGRGRRRR
jgi:hypothetical protein